MFQPDLLTLTWLHVLFIVTVTLCFADERSCSFKMVCCEYAWYCIRVLKSEFCFVHWSRFAYFQTKWNHHSWFKVGCGLWIKSQQESTVHLRKVSKSKNRWEHLVIGNWRGGGGHSRKEVALHAGRQECYETAVCVSLSCLCQLVLLSVHWGMTVCKGRERGSKGANKETAVTFWLLPFRSMYYFFLFAVKWPEVCKEVCFSSVCLTFG